MTTNTSQIIIGGLIVLGFFGSLFILLARPETITDVNRDAVFLMIGALVAGFSTLIGFFFGSSAGSARKTNLLAKAEPIIELTKPVQ